MFLQSCFIVFMDGPIFAAPTAAAVVSASASIPRAVAAPATASALLVVEGGCSWNTRIRIRNSSNTIKAYTISHIAFIVCFTLLSVCVFFVMELCYYAHVGVYSNICYRTAFNRVLMHGTCVWLLYLWIRISFLQGEKACSRRRAVCAGCCSRLLACDLVWVNCCLFIHDVFEVQAVFEEIDAAENGCISACEAGAKEVGYIFC